MADQGGGRGRPKDLDKREAIVRAAHALFTRDGLDGVSMDAVAAEAGVSKRTVYNHFGDKESLFEAVVSANRRALPSLLEATAGVEDIRRRLITVGVPLILMITSPESDRFGRLMISQAEKHRGAIARFHEAGPLQMSRDLATMLRRATESGQLAVPDPELAVDQLVSMWLGQQHFRQLLGLVPPRTPEQVAAHVVACTDMFLRAYAPADPDRPR